MKRREGGEAEREKEKESLNKARAVGVPTRPLIPIPISTHPSETPSRRTTSSPRPYASTSPTMAQPPTYPAHRPTIPHSNTPTDRSIPTNYQAAPRLSFYPTTLNGPEN